MKKQYLTAGIAALLLLVIYLFGSTSKPRPAPVAVKEDLHDHKEFSLSSTIDTARLRLQPSDNSLLTKLEDDLRVASTLQDKIAANNKLAAFWEATGKSFEAYAAYTAAAAKLDNSEKNLNFAARLFLENLRHEQDHVKLEWGSAEAIALFQHAIALNPNNEDHRVGLGSVYVFGRGRTGEAAETMKGIQELLTVVRSNPNNMKAQLVLGIGGLISGQLDNAIARLSTVVKAEPGNVEAVMYLADAYAAKGDKANAVKWYTLSKRLINDPKYSKEADERIKQIP